MWPSWADAKTAILVIRAAASLAVGGLSQDMMHVTPENKELIEAVKGLADIEEGLEKGTKNAIKGIGENIKSLKEPIWTGVKRSPRSLGSKAGAVAGDLGGAVVGITLFPTEANSVCSSTPRCLNKTTAKRVEPPKEKSAHADPDRTGWYAP